MFEAEIDSIIAVALREDMPQGDITSENVIPAHAESQAVLMAKAEGILAGINVAQRVFFLIDDSVNFSRCREDGGPVHSGDILAEIQGSTISILKGERTALNFLQRMSGIASYTHKFVKALEGSRTRILDTRKTTPGLRILEKYAVRMGGGQNHRMSLSDMVMLKDNHLKAVGSISEAVRQAREKIPPDTKIEVETTSLAEVKEALACGADVIMLDNMTQQEMQEAVREVKGRVPLEISGNVDLARLQELAALGVDYISVGRLTHSFTSLDISMEFRQEDKGL
jgi:nicotinate-nucleotide pyrophosphorylase (carboxylating)